MRHGPPGETRRGQALGRVTWETGKNTTGQTCHSKVCGREAPKAGLCVAAESAAAEMCSSNTCGKVASEVGQSATAERCHSEARSEEASEAGQGPVAETPDRNPAGSLDWATDTEGLHGGSKRAIPKEKWARGLWTRGWSTDQSHLGPRSDKAEVGGAAAHLGVPQ